MGYLGWVRKLPLSFQIEAAENGEKERTGNCFGHGICMGTQVFFQIVAQLHDS
jgi:hypothetical protein